MEVSVHLHASATLTLGKEYPVPIVQEAEWAPELVWMLWRRAKSLVLTGIEPWPSSI
jgi:hypothetical protein